MGWVLERRYEEPSYLPSSEVDFSDLGVWCLWWRPQRLHWREGTFDFLWVKTGKGHHSRMTWRSTPRLQGAERTTGKARRGAERRRARPGMVRWCGTVRCSENCHCDLGIWIHAWGSISLPLHAEYVYMNMSYLWAHRQCRGTFQAYGRRLSESLTVMAAVRLSH